MRAQIVPRDPLYVLNHCTKYLARDNTDARHSYWGTYDGQPRSRISEPWRFPVIDSHHGDGPDAYEWNDVTFVHAPQPGAAPPREVLLVTTCNTLWEPIPLEPVADSVFRARTLKVRKGERHRYRFVVDGAARLDAVNPQTEVLPTGEAWSSFFTWACTQPITFERWELVVLDRLVRHVLPFNGKEARNFLGRGANEGNVGHLYRLDVGVGATNYVDKVVAREERHRLYAYRTCLEMLDRVLRTRNPGRDPEFLDESSYTRLYDEMADAGRWPALFADGWNPERYRDPGHFLWLLRRHAMTGAFAHPKYGGNAGGMAWAYLAEHYRTTDTGATAFDWRRSIEPPLGTSAEYRG